MSVINDQSSRFIVLIGLIGSFAWAPREALACSTILDVLESPQTQDASGIPGQCAEGL